MFLTTRDSFESLEKLIPVTFRSCHLAKGVPCASVRLMEVASEFPLKVISGADPPNFTATSP